MQTQVIPSYAYQEYKDDTDIQAFITAYNGMAQEYITWFSSIGLPVYTGPLIVGDLLDWVATGLYGFPRPSLINGTYSPSTEVGEYGTIEYGKYVYGTTKSTAVVSPTLPVTDDIYKRLLTWRFYKGDGFFFSIPWLKRRIIRFLNGVNGTAPVIDNTYPVSVTISSLDVVTITIPQSSVKQYLVSAVNSNVLDLPFQFTYIFA